ncbi:MAG: LysM peptidoglycan-binding domain-containing protein, partial [Anaerolineae bacterium]|nr:LysM peptidoglycan-binding domain-containing protein [Anaerolineae bacterium]
MAEDRFLDILNDCIDRLAAGQSIEDCVQAYPEFADQLRLYLTVGQLPRRAHVPDAEVAQVRSRVREQLDDLLDTWDGTTPPRPFMPWLFVFILALGIPALLFLGSRVLNPATSPEVTEENIEVTAEVLLSVTATLTALPTEDLIEPVLMTETSTMTATSSPTQSRTPRSTASPTVIASATLTATDTATRTATATPLPTMTSSPTEAPTNTAIPTETSIPVTAEDGVCVLSAPEGWVQYQVRNGDTLSGLAATTGSTIEELRRVNCLENVRFIVVRQTLLLPYEPITFSPTTTDTGESDTVDQPPANNEGN